MARLICEHSDCTSEHEFENSHSSVAVLQRVDQGGYTFFQCEQGQDHNFVNWQHYHCCHGHMKEGLSDCLNNHYKEEYLHPVNGGGTTVLHKIVLGSALSCKVCQQPLSNEAHRFCLTRCTPVNQVPDDSLNDLSEWCCSLAHARQSALAIIEGMTDLC